MHGLEQISNDALTTANNAVTIATNTITTKEYIMNIVMISITIVNIFAAINVAIALPIAASRFFSTFDYFVVFFHTLDGFRHESDGHSSSFTVLLDFHSC